MHDKAVNRPRLLDLFCGAGGAAMGYHRAGFDVVGVDNRPQPRYPFEFIQADALELLRYSRALVRNYDAIHASPPCQAHTALSVMWNARAHPDLIGPTRGLLEAIGLPYVIENVPGAPLIDPATICGAAVGLRTGQYDIARHRLFETNWPLMVPPCAHGSRRVLGVYGDHARDDRLAWAQRRLGGKRPRPFRAVDGLAMAREAFEMPWANFRELAQAVPPAYTELIGYQLLQYVRVRAVA